MTPSSFNPDESVIDFHLLGEVSFEDCLVLQRRLVYEANYAARPRATILLCEHSPIITVGRTGSREHIRIAHEQLQRQQLSIRWVEREGGCVLHTPGQLAVYVVMPLDDFGWTEEAYKQRLHRAIYSAIESLNISPQPTRRKDGVWGKTGLLATLGAAFQESITLHGAFVNVAPAMNLFAKIETAAKAGKTGEAASMSCLLAERRLPVRMSDVRTRIVESLVSAFDCARYNVHTGHSWLRDTSGFVCESAFNAS